MLIDFFKEGKQVEAQYPFNVYAGREFVNTFPEETQTKIAVQLNRWVWDTDLLGEFPGAALARGYESIFRCTVGRYKMFKYECLVEKRMTQEEFKEAVIERIFNSTYY